MPSIGKRTLLRWGEASQISNSYPQPGMAFWNIEDDFADKFYQILKKLYQVYTVSGEEEE